MLLVIGLHELGHYFAAKCLGVGVRQIVLGLGKPFYRKTLASGLVLGVTPYPIGGYVKLLDEREAPLLEEEKPRSFTYQAPWRRIVILLAGSAVNFLVAFLIFSSIFFVGMKQTSVIIGDIDVQSIAAKGGLQAGDLIQSIDGWQTPNWSLALLSIMSHSGNHSPMMLTIKRGNETNLTAMLSMTAWNFNGLRQTPLDSLGIQLPEVLTKEMVRYGGMDAFKQGACRTWQYLALNLSMMKNIATRKISIAALSGPLTLVEAAQSELDLGLMRFLSFIALLSVAVGLINLLPLPSLDGGHILYVLIEKVRGKAMALDVEVLIYRFMLAALFIFCMQLLANDLNRLATPQVVESQKSVTQT